MNLLLVLLLSTASYIALHEALHYLVAAALGCKPRLSKRSDGITYSIAVHVECGREDIVREAAILYAPYILNLGLIVVPGVDPAVRLLALLTLPNMLLERGGGRGQIVKAVLVLLILAMCAELLLVAAPGRHGGAGY